MKPKLRRYLKPGQPVMVARWLPAPKLARFLRYDGPYNLRNDQYCHYEITAPDGQPLHLMIQRHYLSARIPKNLCPPK